jgi:hypothetical protein
MGTEAERGDMGKTFTALVRIHEANCTLEFPSPEEQNFRIAIMKQIGLNLNLAEVRQTQITGPAKGLQRPQKTPA